MDTSIPERPTISIQNSVKEKSCRVSYFVSKILYPVTNQFLELRIDLLPGGRLGGRANAMKSLRGRAVPLRIDPVRVHIL